MRPPRYARRFDMRTRSGHGGTPLGFAATIVFLLLLVAPAGATPAALGSWTETASMTCSRHALSGTLLADGRALVAGGNGDCGITVKAGATDPAPETGPNAGGSTQCGEDTTQ